MKKLFAIVVMTVFLTSCGSGNSASNNSDQSQAAAVDSVKRADSVMQTGDTSALNGPMGDSIAHGLGSKPKVGGEIIGGSQGKKGK